MKIFFILNFIAIVCAAIIPFEGLRQQNDTTNIINEADQNLKTTIFNDDGYKYRSVNLIYRQRRDIAEDGNEYLPPNDMEESSTEKNGAEVKSDEEPQESVVLGENGYEYKTVLRLKYRQRRDVSEIVKEYLPPSEETKAEVKEYLPPTEEATTEAVAEMKSAEEPQESAALGENGYEYKTVRRLKYRQRRDVSEIANEYIPPSEEAVTEAAAEAKSVEETKEDLKEYLPPSEESSTETTAEVKSNEEPQEPAALGENGYEYKTVRRLKYRQRRDVSEFANEYIPPSEEAVTEAATDAKSGEETKADVKEYLPPSEDSSAETILEVKSNEEPQESAALGENGYEYKIVRRLRYRRRRDVSEIAEVYISPSEEFVTEAVSEGKSIEETKADVKEYLPPAEESSTDTIAEVKSNEKPQESAILGENGYEYKTVRRLKYHHRRDVSEIANEYIPPSAEPVTEAAAEAKSVEETKADVKEYLPPAEESSTETIAEVKSNEEPQESAILGENGYEYKTVHHLKYRQRRDVSEIANEYLPPSIETISEVNEYFPLAEGSSTETIADVKSDEEPEESAVLGENGYEYKTVRHLKYRQRRDVSEIADEYLPPSEESNTQAAAEAKSAEETKADIKEYLPPAEESSTETIVEVKSNEEPEESAVLGENGYEYKTVRRLKYRLRREVAEIANEYIPPSVEGVTDAAAEAKSVEEAKADVKEYLPPAEESSAETVAEVKLNEELQESAALGENGYEYKTVRRLKYRQRRDISEIANEYLPPSEESVTEAVAVAKSVEETKIDVKEYLPPAEESSTKSVAEEKSNEDPQESVVLGENGYEYKTVRRLKYRQRRDGSEFANEYLPPSEEINSEINEYLPPAEESPTETIGEVKSAEELQESAVLGEMGYEYKTVRRLKYRQRR